MKTKPENRSIGLAILIAILTTSAKAQLVNGDFESPTIADGTFQATTPSGWSGGGVLMNPNASGGIPGNQFTWPQAQSGQQFEDIGNTATFALSQSFMIGSSGIYNFGWYDNTALNMPVGFQAAPYSISLVDSSLQPVLSRNLDSWHTGLWQLNTVSQQLTPGSYTLTFTSLNLPDHTDTLIDNVAIVPVPEPSSILLASCGIAALCFHRRRLYKYG